MTLQVQKVLNVAMVILSWATVPFLGLQNIKRFFPASLLITVIEGINAIIGKKRKWWFFYTIQFLLERNSDD